MNWFLVIKSSKQTLFLYKIFAESAQNAITKIVKNRPFKIVSADYVYGDGIFAIQLEAANKHNVHNSLLELCAQLEPEMNIRL